MKHIIISIILSLLTASHAFAQSEIPDSLSSLELAEIVIEAPKVIHKVDMDVYHPSQSAVDNAKNGVQLLANLMIPVLSVSDALGTITSAGQAVQVRINGREASVEQVKNLLPSSIKRVEWIENPGLRYNGANTVLNLIVTNPTIGGAFMLNAMQGLNKAFGKYNSNVKFNFGHSQIEVGGDYKLTQNLKAHRDYYETFNFSDGTSLTRDEKPLGGRIDNSMGNLWATYNYIKPDTTIVVVDARGLIKPTNKEAYYGLMSSSAGASDVLLTDAQGTRGSRPSLSAYWEQHFAGRQMLVVDFKTQYYMGRTFSDYMEQYPDSREYLADIHTDIKDRNQLYAIETDYIKNWSKSRLTAGASYTANRNKSTYENLGGEVFHQRQDKVYFFVEYFQRVNKFTFTAGLGAQYTDLLFRETGLGSSCWNLRPQAAVTYSLNQRHQFRLNFESWQSTPSLAETNPNPQQIDGFQWRVGNPSLKTSNSYMLTLRYNFQIPHVYGQFGIRAYSSPDAITPLLKWEGERLITTYENSRGLRNISLFLAPQIEVIPDWLMLSGYLQWRAERMRGTGYTLTNSAWSGNLAMQLSHWGFTLSAQYVRAQRDLWGEKISWGEDFNLIDLTYNWKQWGFSVGCFMPFGRYDQGSINLSKWNTNERHMRTDFSMPYISVDYNLQWGRQKHKANKLINVSGDTDRSTAGGR
ncbi:MAG: outer membrane beta-barrel family protein [Muribaculaceae bacterium]|nr:outer membrane beta-barrel family protein [Muribaculaceae bacterium]